MKVRLEETPFMEQSIAPIIDPTSTLGEGSPPPAAPPRHRRRHRRWPWIVLAVALLLGGGAAALWFTSSPARQVSLKQAESRLPRGASGPIGGRPVPGVYEYRGSGTERLSSPPKSQVEGPLVPGTVSLQGQDCWTFRLDYSTHHWQAWDYCRTAGELKQTGGSVWMLWSIGPLSVTNSTSIACVPEATVIPSAARVGQTWTAHCRATSSAVKGTMDATVTYRYLGVTTVEVGGQSVRADRLSITQTDQGAQKGTESYQLWAQVGTGLPLRLDQDVKVVTSSPFGTATYTQVGTLSLASLQPHQG